MSFRQPVTTLTFQPHLIYFLFQNKSNFSTIKIAISFQISVSNDISFSPCVSNNVSVSISLSKDQPPSTPQFIAQCQTRTPNSVQRWVFGFIGTSIFIGSLCLNLSRVLVYRASNPPVSLYRILVYRCLTLDFSV